MNRHRLRLFALTDVTRHDRRGPLCEGCDHRELDHAGNGHDTFCETCLLDLNWCPRYLAPLVQS